MQNIRELLDIKLLSQPFQTPAHQAGLLESARQTARLYSHLENGISVLSDLQARKSYLYYGALASRLGLQPNETEINSIWEEELLSTICAPDLQKKYRLELRFFQLLNTLEPESRTGYEMVTKLRAKSADGKNLLLKHRLLYIGSSADGNVWLALCLYTQIYDYPGFDAPDGVILNTASGQVTDVHTDRFSEILSDREKEVMQLIRLGHRSKEIAEKLQLSINTVNRHRQNIFRKLNVTNAIEACRLANAAGLV